MSSLPVYYQQYFEKVPKGDPILLLELNLKESIKTLVMVNEEKANWSYVEGKWSIKDIIQHLIDTERIFCFRALSFARGETNELLGYDHNAYVINANAKNRSLKNLLEEFKRLRLSTIDLFNSFSLDMLEKKGQANGNELSVGQIMHIIIGHEIHHMDVIQQKYLNA